MVRNKTLYGILALMGGGVLVGSFTGTAIPGTDYVIDIPGYVVMTVVGLMLVGVV